MAPNCQRCISKRNLNIEKNGPKWDADSRHRGDDKRFDPEVIITHFAPVTGK